MITVDQVDEKTVTIGHQGQREDWGINDARSLYYLLGSVLNLHRHDHPVQPSALERLEEWVSSNSHNVAVISKDGPKEPVCIELYIDPERHMGFAAHAAAVDDDTPTLAEAIDAALTAVKEQA